MLCRPISAGRRRSLQRVDHHGVATFRGWCPVVNPLISTVVV